MHIVNDLYYWTDIVLYWGLVVLRGWAFFDCVARKHAAFSAVDKLTKPAWLAMLLIAGLFGSWISPAPTGPISLISAVIAAVYLADVRPAVREIGGGAH